MTNDPFAQFKASQRQGWSLFAPVETMTTIPAAQLVRFARIEKNDTVLDIGCGTGVVAVTAARTGARVKGIDLTPELLVRARENAVIAEVEIDYAEGDVEALPYPDASFDVVVSQFGHMFAPRPGVAVAEMLRVLKPGGRIAFTTWPPELFTGTVFSTVARFMPPRPAGAPAPQPPPMWGDPNIVRERLGTEVTDVRFERGTLITPVLSPQHARLMFEKTIGPVAGLVGQLASDPARLAELRAALDAEVAHIYANNALRQHFPTTSARRV